MSPRYAALSLVALSVIFVLILKNYETWTRPIETASERNTAKKQEAKTENPPALRPQKVEGPAQPYVAIAAKNIFSPDRKDFPVQSSEARRIVRPQVVLYGVTIGDGYQFASVVNPGRSLLRGERETLSLKVGDKVGDYKLARISSDRITLEAEGDVFEVLLYDPKTPKKRSDVRTAVSTPTTPAPPSGEPAKTASQTQPVPQKELPQPRVVPPPAPTYSTPQFPFRRGRIPPAGYASEAAPTGGTLTGVTPPVTGQTKGTGGN